MVLDSFLSAVDRISQSDYLPTDGDTFVPHD